MKHAQTGKIAYLVHKVKKLDYEFECEALADFAFLTERPTQAAGESAECEKELLSSFSMAGPQTFTHGRTQYSQVKTQLHLPQAALELLAEKHKTLSPPSKKLSKP